MKKLAVALALALVCAVLAGCGAVESGAAQEQRMVTLYNNGTTQIIADMETGVEYLIRYQGGTVIMVDADGKPLIWEGVNQ